AESCVPLICSGAVFSQVSFFVRIDSAAICTVMRFPFFESLVLIVLGDTFDCVLQNNSMATRLVGKSGNIFAWCYCSYDAIGNESAALRPFKSCVLAAVCPGRIVDSRAPPRMSTFVALHSHAL